MVTMYCTCAPESFANWSAASAPVCVISREADFGCHRGCSDVVAEIVVWKIGRPEL